MWEIIKALILTILIEGIVILIIKKNFVFLIYSVIINIITNVSLTLIVNQFVNSELWKYIVVVAALEIVILFVEALIYNIKIKKFKKALLLSLILNLTSFSFGFLMYIPF